MGMVPELAVLEMLVWALLSVFTALSAITVLEDDFVLAIAGRAGTELPFFWNIAFGGGVVSSGVAGIGVGSTISSSRSPSPFVDADTARAIL